jgi:hypothetical protein
MQLLKTNAVQYCQKVSRLTFLLTLWLKMHAFRWAKIFQENQTWEKRTLLF